MKKIIVLFVVVLSLLALTACNQNNSLTVSDASARPGRMDGNSAVFFEINNQTGEDDSLLSASSDIAQAVEIHKTTDADGKMTMERQDFVPVPSGQQVIFKTGDLHVMLIGLNKDLLPGDTFSVTLTFKNAGEIVFDVSVQEP